MNYIAKVPQNIAQYLGLPEPCKYKGHCFRRSSATLLVNGGGDILQLKKHGGWKSTNVAEGYIDVVSEYLKRKKMPDVPCGQFILVTFSLTIFFCF